MRRILLLALICSGCSGSSAELADTGGVDGGTADRGQPPADSGIDAGPDVGAPDADPADAGAPELQLPDAYVPEEGTLSVVTWNIETYPKTAFSAAMVVQLIENMQPDVLAIQEIDDYRAFNALVDELEEYDGLQVFDPRNFLRVGVLFHNQRVTLLENETLFDDDNYAFPRPPLRVRVQRIGTNFDMDVLVLHLKARIDSESQARRRTAIQRLDRWLQVRVATETDIAVVGDYNDKIEDRPEDNVFTPFLSAPERYRFLTEDLVAAGEITYVPFPGFIDHIVVTTDALDEYGPTGTTEVMRLDMTVPGYLDHVSDHLPVRAIFRNLD